MIFEWDDFGANHIISDMCQSHDCRDKLDELHILNPAFKATLFAIPAEMTLELAEWCLVNSSWIELAYHGFSHSSNYECEKWTYQDMEDNMMKAKTYWPFYFRNIFRAPGWQISTAAMQWLADNEWVVADQDYNNERRPKNLKAWINKDGNFRAWYPKSYDSRQFEVYHGHTWDVGWNGIYEDFEKVSALVKDCKEFKFISEVF